MPYVSKLLIRLCSSCGKKTGDYGTPAVCTSCRRDRERGTTPKASSRVPAFAREAAKPIDYELGQLPCRRCGKLVLVAKSIEQGAKLGMTVEVECNLPCVRTVEVASDE